MTERPAEEKLVLRSGLYLGPKNPVDKARPGPAAAAPNVPLASSRPPSALPAKRPLTANPASAAAKRPHSRTGLAPPIDAGGFLSKAYSTGAPPLPGNATPDKPPTSSTLFRGFPYGGTGPPGAGAFVASARTPSQRPPSDSHGASSLLTRLKKAGGADAASPPPKAGARPFSALPSALDPGTSLQPAAARPTAGAANGSSAARAGRPYGAGRVGPAPDRGSAPASPSPTPHSPMAAAGMPRSGAGTPASASRPPLGAQPLSGSRPNSRGTAKYEHAFQPRGVNPRLRMADPDATALERTSDNIEDDLANLERRRAEFAAEVAVRVRKWYQLLQVFKKQPDSVEFVYLTNASPNSVHFHPYNLEVVQHADIRGSTDYYTMSSQGVTHFWQDRTDFQPLESFERDYFLYAQTMRLRMFRQFRMWKAFKVWRRSVATRKASVARQVLTKNLFILHPVFREAILRIRAACNELAAQRLHALTPGEAPISLEAFLARHRTQAEAMLRMLHDFSRGVVHTTQDACFRAIELLEQTLLASKEKSNPTSNRITSAAATSVRLAVVRATNMAEDAQFSYAINAARRSEKRRVHNFVRLLDYLVCNALHLLLVGSTADMLNAFTPATPPDVDQAAFEAQGLGLPTPGPASPEPAKMAGQSEGLEDDMQDDDQDPLMLLNALTAKWGGPLLQLQVLLEDTSPPKPVPGEVDEGAEEANLVLNEPKRVGVGWSLPPDGPDASNETLVLHPPPLAFHNAIMEIQDGFVSQVQVVRRLLLHEKLKDYMEQPLDSNDSVDVEGFDSIILGEEHVAVVQELIGRLRDAFQKAEQLRDKFLPFRDLVIANRQVSEASMMSEVNSGRRNIATFRRDMDHFRRQLHDIRRIQPKQELGVLVLHLEEMLRAFLPSPQRCLQAITELLPKLTAERYAEFIDKVHTATAKLQQAPTSVEELADYLELHAALEKERHAYDREYDRITSFVDMMHEYSIPVPDLQAASYAAMDSDYTALRDAMWSADASRDSHIMRFNVDLEAQVDALNKEVMDIRLSAQHEMILDDDSSPDQVTMYTLGLLERVAAQQQEADKINKFQRMFRLKETKFQDLMECEDDVKLRHALWESRVEWENNTQAWLETPLSQIDGEALENAVTRFNKQVYKMERGLETNKVVPKLRESLNTWREFVPVVQNLINPDLKDRHWTKLIDVLGEYVDRGDSLTLEALFKIKIVDHKDLVMLISTEATQEAALEGMLDKINDKWRHTEFTINSYKELKDTYILGGVDEVMMVLEDCMVAVATISSSRFVGGIRHEVEKTEKALRLFSDTMDEWLECQRQWLYLETIFSAQDIQKQLPAEAKAFIFVDRQFKDIMRKAKDRPNAMMAATAPGVLDAFKRCNETLETIQKNLEDYLETKRVSFPRFYFLSNDELLEILSQTRNVQAVQPHLQKCFDGIRYLDFGEDPKSITIHAMVSGEGERVPLGPNLKARGAVEMWLTQVEANMRLSIKAAARQGIKSYTSMERTDWVQENPAQLVIVVSNVFWCKSVAACLSKPDPNTSLKLYLRDLVSALRDLICLVRSRLSSLLRKTLGALITVDVHNRDIVESLINNKVRKPSEFGWQMQLRYEYDAEVEQVSVLQVNARFNYGWEYLGAQPRLVVTPMTDRCYMTLTGALHMRLGGAPAGPAGTGKTETTKDLGKALGIQCVVFNCGENLDYRFMGKFFSGLAQCGAWACFDEFNRIDIEVLSVVAQQLLAIQNALKGNLERFLFEAREIRLLPTCGVFITMNPGYAGRTELPDNLKALFRPMSMMIPDYALVAEVMLFSEGFEDAKNLSRKMVLLYKLASEQLSQQDHYDFGMRALKSVLVMAGTLKRSNPNLSEDIVLIRAIRDSNIPKFLSEDARLFNAIVGDLFPGVILPTTNYGALQLAVDNSCIKAGLQPVPSFSTKVIQLYETFNVRFGVMLVGPAGGGKTRCYQTLKSAMTQLRKESNPDPNFQPVHTVVLNPKSIKMGELYGEYNVLTNEWQDGLASSIIRGCVAQSTSDDRRWVVFDGPVDAIWVENMNTVLDDNCTLCLPNAERIKLNPVTMRMLFEVADLAVASPATVSRCGMVYVPPDCVGWRPYVKSWLASLPRAHGLVDDEHQQGLRQIEAEFAASRRLSTATSQTGNKEAEEAHDLGNVQDVEHAEAGSDEEAEVLQEGIPATAAAMAAASATYHPELLQFIYELFDRFVEPMLAFLRANCSEALPSSDINLVTSVAQIFTAVTHPSHGMVLSGELEDSTKYALQYAFSFAAVWGIGGNMNSSCWDKWDPFVRELFEGTANFPGGSGSVFDYYLDSKRNFMLSHWDDLVPKFVFQPALPYFQILVPTTDTTRYAYLLKTCLEVEHSVLFTGSSGVGKTAVILDTLSRLADEQYGTVDVDDGKDGDASILASTVMTRNAASETNISITPEKPVKTVMPVVINFSAQTNSAATQAMIESKLERKRKQRYGPPVGRHVVLFVDDVNMPMREVHGSQPPLELLRQLLDFGGFYDRKKLEWMGIQDTTLCAACGPPGGGRQEVSSRFLRHFTLLNLPPPSELIMRHVFSTILGGFFDTFFSADVKSRMLKPMVSSAIEVYLRIANELLPTPAKSHYTFNLRDVSKVFQGILDIRPGECPEPRITLMRLWVHENMRVFHDRLICKEDKDYFKGMLYEMLKSKFEVREEYEAIFGPGNEIMFGDYMQMGAPRDKRVYEEVGEDFNKVVTLMGNYLEEYNMEHTAPLHLVFFMDAVQHISRIARILRQPRGSAMLVGVGGSGKQSLTRFAAFISETQCVSIELTRNYGLTEFRESIKKLYKIAGVEGRHVAFLFTDNHIVNESFVEDVNNMLNSGEITGLFPADERERIYQEIRPWVVEQGIAETRDAMWSTFINRVRDNLHIVLAMSPVGESFRARCRQYPSLISCCTIDWFSPWPAEALKSVSTRFLESQQLGGDLVNAAIASMCVDIHLGVAESAEAYYAELRRRYYVTPKSYLDLIHLYISLLRETRQEMAMARDRLLNGLSKLQETNIVVDRMQTELNELQPVLAEKTKDTQRLLAQVDAERSDAEAIRHTVVEEEVEVKLKQAETQHLKDDAQKDLEHVLPALEDAEKALASLNKNDIIEIKTFTKPPALVLLTMEGVCTVLGERADWDTAKRVLGDNGFIKRLVEFDKDNISERAVRLLKRIIDDPQFTPDQVAKQSKAAMSMCLWVRAIDTYAKVSKVVEPKRLRLREAQTALDAMNAKFAEKREQLMQIERKVDDLQKHLQKTQTELSNLQQQADLSSKRLGRAAKLISALGDESVRWRSTADDLGDKMLLLVGDVFLSAACISYTGAFTGPYRNALISSWIRNCAERDIPVSQNFSLQATLSTSVEIREWNLQGLPTDSLSMDNGILVTRGSRWPLMVDPQDQANRWVKAMESKNGLRSLRVSDPNILRTLENCVRVGNPVLLEDVGESLEPALDPLLLKQTFMQGTRNLIRLGDTDVDYDPQFRFYMTTKIPNPHYLPEVCIKVNLINFTVTRKGLEDQLLGDVVRKERPDLEEMKDRLVVSISNDKRQLAELEDKVLKLLRDSTGNILDDEVLINVLNTSKTTSGQINTRMRDAEDTERAINTAREVYRTVPVRGSILYFVIADLAGIDPMYQYSLSYFATLFNQCITDAAPSDDLPSRLNSLLEYITEFMYRMVCRGLFEAHKGIFSFLIASAIQRDAGVIPPELWSLLLRGSNAGAQLSEKPQPATMRWLNPNGWAALRELQAAMGQLLPNDRLLDCLKAKGDMWRRVGEAPEPWACPELVTLLEHDLGLPLTLSDASKNAARGSQEELQAQEAKAEMVPFLVLLLVRIMAEDKLTGAVQRYVATVLGPQYNESPSSSLADVYKDSNPATPIIFILSQGADPTSSLARFGEGMDRVLGTHLHVISLGQGQGPIAESTLNMAVRTGDWVCLQNCHLAKSWMPRLERLVEDLQSRYQKQEMARVAAESALAHEDSNAASENEASRGDAESVNDAMSMRSQAQSHKLDVHPDFRLWLTSMPAPHFPVPVLQNGIKITQEPPKGVRANLLRTYHEMPSELLDPPPSAPQAPAWRKLVFSAAFFHAIIQERRKFGPLGWNIGYEFNTGDLECALKTLSMFMEQAEDGHIPWEALTYVTGQINYGGRVTDDNDRRLLMCTLSQFYRPEALKDGHAFCAGGYRCPPGDSDLATCCAHIKALPRQEAPEVFGLHANAAIAFNLQEARKVLDAVLAIQPRLAPSASGSGAKSSETLALEVASSIEEQLPEAMQLSSASMVRSPFALLPSGHDNSLGTVLKQEIDRFNTLLAVLKRSCTELQRAVKGLAIMSPSLEDMAASLVNNQVPSLWSRTAYPSLKPLASWVADFKARVAFMDSWLMNGEPTSFWLSGLFFPQGFMTAVLQNHARKTGLPIDRFSFGFKVLRVPEGAAKQLAKEAAAKKQASSAMWLPPSAPAEGVYVHGLFLEGARWDEAAGTLCEARAREMTCQMPPIHFLPTDTSQLQGEGPHGGGVGGGGGSNGGASQEHSSSFYECPLYKTSVRAGVLSTTGQSTNFVLHIRLPLPGGVQAEKSVMQGVAALCALSS